MEMTGALLKVWKNWPGVTAEVWFGLAWKMVATGALPRKNSHDQGDSITLRCELPGSYEHAAYCNYTC